MKSQALYIADAGVNTMRNKTTNEMEKIRDSLEEIKDAFAVPFHKDGTHFALISGISMKFTVAGDKISLVDVDGCDPCDISPELLSELKAALGELNG